MLYYYCTEIKELQNENKKNEGTPIFQRIKS